MEAQACTCLNPDFNCYLPEFKVKLEGNQGMKRVFRGHKFHIQVPCHVPFIYCVNIPT